MTTSKGIHRNRRPSNVRTEQDAEMERICLTCTLDPRICDDEPSDNYRGPCPYIQAHQRRVPVALRVETAGKEDAINENLLITRMDKAASKVLQQMNGGRVRRSVWDRLTDSD